MTTPSEAEKAADDLSGCGDPKCPDAICRHQKERIASALLAAEARGVERAAKVADRREADYRATKADTEGDDRRAIWGHCELTARMLAKEIRALASAAKP